MKNNIGFLNIEETDNGDSIWNGLPVNKTTGKKPKILEKIDIRTPGFQKVKTDTSNIPMKKVK